MRDRSKIQKILDSIETLNNNGIVQYRIMRPIEDKPIKNN